MQREGVSKERRTSHTYSEHEARRGNASDLGAEVVEKARLKEIRGKRRVRWRDLFRVDSAQDAARIAPHIHGSDVPGAGDGKRVRGEEEGGKGGRFTSEGEPISRVIGSILVPESPARPPLATRVSQEGFAAARPWQKS